MSKDNDNVSFKDTIEMIQCLCEIEEIFIDDINNQLKTTTDKKKISELKNALSYISTEKTQTIVTNQEISDKINKLMKKGKSNEYIDKYITNAIKNKKCKETQISNIKFIH